MSSILLLGNGGTNKYLNQIELFSSEQMSALFTGTRLKEAFDMCKNSFDKVYIANVKSDLDYIEVAKYIDEQQYDYICPLDIYMHDYIMLDEKRVPVITVMLDIIRPTKSLVIISDLHASTFFSMEQFIQHYNEKSYLLYSAIRDTAYSKNVIMVANHFKKTQLAQVAFSLDHFNSPINVYIQCTFGNSYYDLDVQDFSMPVVFIKNNTLINSTYENLINFSKEAPYKFILVERIIHYVKKQLDFNWSGKRYIHNIIISQLKTLLKTRLDNLKGFCIVGYSIDDIKVIKKPAYYEIYTYISVIPVLYTEAYNFVLIKKV